MADELSRSLRLIRSDLEASLSHSLVRCRVGTFPLLIDLRDVLTIGRPNEAPSEEIPRTVDLRQVLGVDDSSPAQSIHIGDPQRLLTLLVDPGLQLVRIELCHLYPLPAILRCVPGLGCLKGVVEIDGELAYLLDPRELIPGGVSEQHREH